MVSILMALQSFTRPSTGSMNYTEGLMKQESTRYIFNTHFNVYFYFTIVHYFFQHSSGKYAIVMFIGK